MGKDSSEIRREIEETRARMGDTVEALGYKADVPSRVKDAVDDKVDTVKGTIGDVVDSVKDTIASASGKVGSALGGAKRSVSDTMSGTTDKVGDATSTMTSNVQETIGNVTGKLGSSVSGTLGTVTGNLPSAGDVQDAARRGVGIATQNPLGLALGALAVGFLAGLAAPVTDIERQTVGPIRDDLVDRAKSIGSDVIEHGKQALQETAQSVVQTAVQTVQDHGQQIVSEATGGSTHGEQTTNGQQNTNGQKNTDTGTPEYGVLLDEDDTLEPGKPGTASP